MFLWTVIGRAVDNDHNGVEVVYGGISDKQARDLTTTRHKAIVESFQRAFGHAPTAVHFVRLPYMTKDDEEASETVGEA